MTDNVVNMKLVAANAESDRKLAQIVAGMHPDLGYTDIDKEMVMQVFRPFMHLVNKCAEEDREIIPINDALIATIVAMSTELVTRTISVKNPGMAAQWVQKAINDYMTGLASSVGVNYGIQINLSAGAGVGTTHTPANQH